MKDALHEQNRTGAQPWRRCLLNVSLFVFSFILSFALADWCFARFKLVPDIFRIQVGAEKSAYRLSDNLILGYEMKENWRDRKTPDLYLSYPSTNSHGQRDIERSLDKQPGSKRILLLGDSVVASSYVADLNDSISRQLELLYQQFNIPVEVLNFGITGYSTRQEAELLRVKGLAFSPDLVVLIYVDNDIWDVNGLVHDLVRKRPESINWLFLNSTIFRFLCLRYNWFDFQSETDPGYYARKHEQAIGQDSVKRSLPILKDLAQQKTFQFLILVWPRFSDSEVTEGEMHRVTPSGDLEIEQLAKEFQIPLWRLSPFFKNDYQERAEQAKKESTPLLTPNRLYTVGDQQHPNAEGAKTAARIIQRLLADNPAFLGQAS